MQKGITFLELIEKYKIQIPVIQRDYAQGRLDKKVKEIRNGFLSSINDTLIEESKPMILDFVYGSTQEDNKLFIPLDGQQRLTTLFLLHWYLATDDKLSIFRHQESNSFFSKFTYETRISSKDFCNCIVAQNAYSIIETYKDDILHFDDQIKNVEEQIQLLINAIKINKAIELKADEKSKKDLETTLKQLKNSRNKWCLSLVIKNQSWFMWSWRKDPTVKAMLIMLDEIHSRFGKKTIDSRVSMWNKLENGQIIFHLLPLEKFALTDELYVKMNARGKELSNFDIFKSTMEEQMRINNVSEATQDNWRRNIDSNWIDLFWNKLAKPKLVDSISEEEQIKYVDSVEIGYLRFIKQMMVYHLFINSDCFQCDWNDDNIKRYVPFLYEESNILNDLREYSFNKKKYKDGDILDLMPLFCKTRFFNQNFFDFVINTLESIIYKENNEKYDASELIQGIRFEGNSKTIFESFIDENITYDTRVQFFAVLQFAKYKNAIDIFQNDSLKSEFNSWMRIVRNLSINTNTYFYNGYDDFLKSLVALKNWAEDIYSSSNYQNTIIAYFINDNKIGGFNNDQLEEEKAKAALINYSINWTEAIIKAEEHKYFLGQIRFLLEWSKVEDNKGEKYDLSQFKAYYSKVCSVFGDNALNAELCHSNTHLFRNLLMTHCDNYLLNDSFMNNGGKDRDKSWKRYLREETKSINIKQVLDKWNTVENLSFEDFCKKEIQQQTVIDWRKYFIEKPEIYNQLYHNNISWWNRDSKEICLLTKTKWSSEHRELRTYFWFLKYKKDNDSYLTNKDETRPFSAVFRRDNQKEYAVKFVPKWGQVGQYVICSNFDTKLEGMSYNIEGKIWEQYFDSDKIDSIEKCLEKLNT